MNNYYKPDSRWEMYQISDKDEFAEKLVNPGYFHDDVPKDVIEAYNTVEYLMAHSYYYWPMYDEAFHKVLLIIEMGIKLKAKQLDIPLFRRKKNGERWERKLSKIINDVCKEDYLGDLKQKLDRSRKLRNMQSHPKQHSFSGPGGGIDRNIRYCVNVLNRLFRNNEWHLEHQRKTSKVERNIAQFKNELLIIEDEKGANLISSILDFDIINNTLFISCLPVIDVQKLNADNHDEILPNSSTYKIEDYEIIDGKRIIGKTLSGTEIKIYVTNQDEAIWAFQRQKAYLDAIPDEKKVVFVHFNNQESGWQLSEVEYKYMAECVQ